MKKYMRLYTEIRRQYPTYPAAQAMRDAKRRETIEHYWGIAEEEGRVRLRIEPDDICDLDDLLGTMFDPKANPDISPSKLQHEKDAYIERINRDGVWGVIGEWLRSGCPECGRGGEWEHAGSCWGFVGDDWRGSCDLDIMAETLAAAGIYVEG